MINTKTTERAKKNISSAFLQILLEKDFEEVSITNICEKAMITRATFYKYFDGKYDIADFAIKKIHEQVFDEQMSTCKFKTTKEVYLKFVEICLDHIEKHKKTLRFL